MISLGSLNLKLFAGSTPIQKAYLGDVLVYSLEAAIETYLRSLNAIAVVRSAHPMTRLRSTSIVVSRFTANPPTRLRSASVVALRNNANPPTRLRSTSVIVVRPKV